MKNSLEFFVYEENKSDINIVYSLQFEIIHIFLQKYENIFAINHVVPFFTE